MLPISALSSPAGLDAFASLAYFLLDQIDHHLPGVDVQLSVNVLRVRLHGAF